MSVGKASKIDPSFIVEEELDYLIVGDIISKMLPSMVIQDWVIKYRENNNFNLILKALSGFIITQNEIKDTLWAEFIQSNIKTKTFHPPILLLKLHKSDLVSETGVHDLVKEYSNKYIEFITNNLINDSNEKYQNKRDNLGK